MSPVVFVVLSVMFSVVNSRINNFLLEINQVLLYINAHVDGVTVISVAMCHNILQSLIYLLSSFCNCVGFARYIRRSIG